MQIILNRDRLGVRGRNERVLSKIRCRGSLHMNRPQFGGSSLSRYGFVINIVRVLLRMRGPANLLRHSCD